MPEEMKVIPEEVGVEHTTSPKQNSWANTLSPEECEEIPKHPPMYVGEDEEEKYPSIDELFITQEGEADQPPKFSPRVEISKEKYISVFKT